MCDQHIKAVRELNYSNVNQCTTNTKKYYHYNLYSFCKMSIANNEENFNSLLCIVCTWKAFFNVTKVAYHLYDM